MMTQYIAVDMCMVDGDGDGDESGDGNQKAGKEQIRTNRYSRSFTAGARPLPYASPPALTAAARTTHIHAPILSFTMSRMMRQMMNLVQG